MNQRNVVVTGGRGGLGGGVVDVLKARGANVIVAPDRPELDFADEQQVVDYFAKLPPLWASIHLIGGFAMQPVTETSLADFERQWRINTVTCFLTCREAVRAIRKTGAGGRIVNVAARPAVQPVGGMIAYSVAKAGVAALTQALALEVAADDILVNAVLPSTIDTPANRAAMPSADHARWTRPAELGEAIAFLASTENTATSGALLPAYGRG